MKSQIAPARPLTTYITSLYALALALALIQ
jgi:hypothetical protein